MKLPCLLQPRILKQAVTALVSRPFTTKFPKDSYEPQPSFRGRPRFNEAGCIGCTACAQVCPPKCIDVIDDVEANPPVRRLIHHVDACIWCGQCERYCVTQEGIKQTTEYDCVGFKPEDFEDEIDKELLLCEVCGDVIAPADQIRHLAEKLGPIAFANPTVMMVVARDMGVADEGVKSDSDAPLRSDRLSLQCPKCLRKSALAV